MAVAEAVLCLTLALYEEARSEPTEAFNAVGNVVLNRADNSDNLSELCNVVLHKKHFTWTKKLKTRDTFGLMDYQANLLASINQKDFKAYQKAEKIALTMVQGDYSPKYEYSHFYSGKPPYWAKDKPAKKIGKLYFVKGVD